MDLVLLKKSGTDWALEERQEAVVLSNELLLMALLPSQVEEVRSLLDDGELLCW